MNTKKQFLAGLVSMVLMLALGMTAGAQDDPVEIRWFVGLGAGTDAPQIERQEVLVAEFNESQDDIELVLEIVDADVAYGVLSTQIGAGNAPDIVGPVGVRGRSNFPGAFLDLTDLIEANDYDLSDFDPELVDFYNIEGEGQVGLPFAIFPYFMIYNVDLFDEAGIPYPPRNYGDPYVDWNGEEREWNMETLREVAMIMTVDGEGYDAMMEEFDPEDIVQFGYGTQFTDLRGRLTMFGAGSFIDDEGNAQVPDQWRDGLEWYQDGMWEDYFYPNAVYGNSDLLGAGDWFQSGNLAMVGIHLWYLPCCTAGLNEAGMAYQLAPVPSHEGVTTAKMHGDTFSIMEGTDHPQEAFEVLTWMVGEKAEDFATLYGGMPARLSLQEDYFDNIASQAPLSERVGDELYWDLVVDGMAYADNPSHEGPLPNLLEAEDVYNTWTSNLDNNADFDLETEIDNLIEDLQVVFDTAS